MKSDRIFEEYVNKFGLKFAVDAATRLPFHIAWEKTASKQLELFTGARLGPEPESADDDADDGQQIAKDVGRDHDAARAIVLSAIKLATRPAFRRRLHGAEALAIVVEVPSPDWAKPVEDYFDSIRSSHWATYARDGSNKSRDLAAMLATSKAMIVEAPDWHPIRTSLSTLTESTATPIVRMRLQQAQARCVENTRELAARRRICDPTGWPSAISFADLT